MMVTVYITNYELSVMFKLYMSYNFRKRLIVRL